MGAKFLYQKPDQPSENYFMNPQFSSLLVKVKFLASYAVYGK